MKELEKYRTWSVCIAAMGVLLAAALCGVHGEDLVTVKWGVGLAIAGSAGRAVSIAAAGGDGFTKQLKNVLTESKPGEAQP